MTRPVVIEKIFGKGSIVLVADGRLFDNRSVAEAGKRLCWRALIGPHTRIVFDESHFGIVESGSVVALARRFRLHGLAARPGDLRAAVHLEERVQLPARGRARRRKRRLSGRTSLAGLVTLLQRHVPRGPSGRRLPAGMAEEQCARDRRRRARGGAQAATGHRCATKSKPSLHAKGAI